MLLSTSQTLTDTTSNNHNTHWVRKWAKTPISITARPTNLLLTIHLFWCASPCLLNQLPTSSQHPAEIQSPSVTMHVMHASSSLLVSPLFHCHCFAVSFKAYNITLLQILSTIDCICPPYNTDFTAFRLLFGLFLLNSIFLCWLCSVVCRLVSTLAIILGVQTEPGVVNVSYDIPTSLSL